MQVQNYKAKWSVWVGLPLLALALFFVIIIVITKSFDKTYYNAGKQETDFYPPTETTTIHALQKVKDTFGEDRADVVERLTRWETSHYKSSGFKNTNAAGMEATRKTDGSVTPYPYGWSSLKSYWDSHPGYAPIGIWQHIDGSGKVKPFLKFSTTEAAFMTLAEYLETHRAGNWYSNELDQQEIYEADLATINPTYTNSLA